MSICVSVIIFYFNTMTMKMQSVWSHFTLACYLTNYLKLLSRYLQIKSITDNLVCNQTDIVLLLLFGADAEKEFWCRKCAAERVLHISQFCAQSSVGRTWPLYRDFNSRCAEWNKWAFRLSMTAFPSPIRFTRLSSYDFPHGYQKYIRLNGHHIPHLFLASKRI